MSLFVTVSVYVISLPASTVDEFTVLVRPSGSQVAGVSNASVPSERLDDDPWSALVPSPRLANAVQMMHALTPPLLA